MTKMSRSTPVPRHPSVTQDGVSSRRLTTLTVATTGEEHLVDMTRRYRQRRLGSPTQCRPPATFVFLGHEIHSIMYRYITGAARVALVLHDRTLYIRSRAHVHSKCAHRIVPRKRTVTVFDAASDSSIIVYSVNCFKIKLLASCGLFATSRCAE